MSTLLRLRGWWWIAAALVWQGAMGVVAAAAEVRGTVAASWVARCCDDSHPRLQRAIGDDVMLVDALRRVARPGEWLLVRVEVMPQQLEVAWMERLTRLRHALFPEPWITNVPDPVGVAEASLPQGRSVLVLLASRDAQPVGRAGWTSLAAAVDCHVWRLERP